MKDLALILMVVDHIGLWLYPCQCLRILGVLAYPLFAYLLVQGEQYTKDRFKYFLRIFLMAVMAQIPFTCLGMEYLNPVFSLAFGLLCIQLHRAFGNMTLLLFILWRVCGFNVYCLAMIMNFYLYSRQETARISALIGIALVMSLVNVNFLMMPFVEVIIRNFGKVKSFFKSKLYYYSFYPVHLAIIAIFRFKLCQV